MTVGRNLVPVNGLLRDWIKGLDKTADFGWFGRMWVGGYDYIIQQ